LRKLDQIRTEYGEIRMNQCYHNEAKVVVSQEEEGRSIFMIEKPCSEWNFRK